MTTTKHRLAPFLALAALAAPLFASHPARACGGCFHAEEQTPAQTSVVSAHRMALSISTTRTILWDQVQYTGSPAEFAWVLPVKPGAYIEVGSDAFFETLDAATTVRPNPPSLDCGEGRGASCAGASAAGCAADGAAGLAADDSGDPGGVTVVHHGSAGPYETVTLHSDEPGALTSWLLANGYAIASDVQPIIDAYETEAFDFIALRLLPDAGVQQMTPVRVVQPGAVATLPLRMVAAGTGANVALTLFILGEGRWAAANFPAVAVDRQQLTWDFTDQMSNYAVLRDSALASGDGRGWLTAYARQGALLAPVENPVTGLPVEYFVGTDTATTIGEAFVRQALVNDETDTAECLLALQGHADDARLVVDPCADPGACGSVGPDQIDARELRCGVLDDLASALVGMHPKDVWLTRLDANLPRWALAQDLEVAPAADQAPVENWILAADAVNAPCPVVGAAPPRPGASRRPGAGVAFGLIGGGLAALFALRRLARALPRRAGESA